MSQNLAKKASCHQFWPVLLLEAFQVTLHFSTLSSTQTFFAGRSARFPTINPIKIYYAPQNIRKSCLLRLTWLNFVWRCLDSDWLAKEWNKVFRGVSLARAPYSCHSSESGFMWFKWHIWIMHLDKNFNTYVIYKGWYMTHSFTVNALYDTHFMQRPAAKITHINAHLGIWPHRRTKGVEQCYQKALKGFVENKRQSGLLSVIS